MTINRIIEYLDGIGLSEKIDALEPGHGLGIEIPVDDNGKMLHFWLSMTVIDETKYAVIDFDDILSIKICTDGDKLDDWLKNSGIVELGEMAIDDSEEAKVTQ